MYLHVLHGCFAMKTVSARQANHEFSDLLSRVERGLDWEMIDDLISVAKVGEANGFNAVYASNSSPSENVLRRRRHFP
jgi:hypothetical protein